MTAMAAVLDEAVVTELETAVVVGGSVVGVAVVVGAVVVMGAWRSVGRRRDRIGRRGR